MKKNQKLLIYGAGGLLALFLLYRWYASRQQAPTATPNPQDQAASDFASLAGTEQSDVAAIKAQEQQDIGALQGQFAGLQGSLSAMPTQADLHALETSQAATTAELTGELSGLSAGLTGLGATISGLQVPTSTTVIQGGAKPSKITTHKGGPFYKFYEKMTGHAPPGSLYDTNPIYQLWKSGFKPPTRKAPKPGGGKGKGHPGGGGKKGKPSGGAGLTGRYGGAPGTMQHTTAHQPINAGHTAGHAAAAVAPSTHAPKTPVRLAPHPTAPVHHPAPPRKPPPKKKRR